VEEKEREESVQPSEPQVTWDLEFVLRVTGGSDTTGGGSGKSGVNAEIRRTNAPGQGSDTEGGGGSKSGVGAKAKSAAGGPQSGRLEVKPR